MKRTLLAVVVLFTALAPNLRAAAASAYSAGTPFVLINGVLSESARAWSGGGMGTSITLSKVVTNGFRAKSVGNIAFDTVTIECELPFSGEVAALFNGLCNGTSGTASITLGQLNHNRVPTGPTLECLDAQLVEVKFPAMEASVKNTGTASFTFQVGQTRTIPTPASVPPAGTVHPKTPSGFTLQVTGLDASRITRVGEFRIWRTLVLDAIGEMRDYQKTSSPTEFSNVKISIAPSADTTWTAWRDDFLVGGNAGDAAEKTGTLNFIGPTGTQLYSLQLLHVGLAHFSYIPPDDGVQARSEVELYVEQIKPGTMAPGATAATSSPTDAKPASKPDTSTPTDNRKKPDATPDSIKGTPRSETPANETKPAEATVNETKPGATAANESKRAEAGTVSDADAIKKPDGTGAVAKRDAMKLPTVKNPDDKGARDPAGSPRPDGTVRKTYFMNKGKGYSQENVSYTTARPMNELEVFYEQALTGDGWEESSRLENDQGLNHTHQLIIKYSKAKDAYTVTFTDTKPGEVTIDIRLDRVF